MQKFLRCWCLGKELDLGSDGRKWNDWARINWSNGNGPRRVKRVIPSISAKALNLIGVDQRVIQVGAMMKSLIHNQNVCLVGGRVIPGCSSGNNRDVQQWFDGFVMCTHINTPGCECKDDKVVAKATSVCTRISFVG